MTIARKIHAWYRWQIAVARWGYRCGKGEYHLRSDSYAEMDHWFKILKGR